MAINITAKRLLAKRAECKRLGEALQRAHTRLAAIADDLKPGKVGLSATDAANLCMDREIARVGAEDAAAVLATCGFKVKGL